MDRKLPIGIQGFEKLRTDHFLYVDKTEYIISACSQQRSLFPEQAEKIWEKPPVVCTKSILGREKDLFSGLSIEKLEEGNTDAWKKYQVFYFDFNGVNYQQPGALEGALNSHLKRWEQQYGVDNSDNTINERFQTLLIKANQKAKDAVLFWWMNMISLYLT